jgi:hypothetical protein
MQSARRLRHPVDGLARAIERHARARPELVIGNRFQLVGLRQEQDEVGQLRFVACELRQQAMNAPVGLGGPPGARTYDGLRPVNSRQARIAAGILADARPTADYPRLSPGSSGLWRQRYGDSHLSEPNAPKACCRCR